MFVKQASNLDYAATLVGGPAGVTAKITRLAPSLAYDVTVVIPGFYELPEMVTRDASTVDKKRVIVHGSFAGLHEACAWVDRLAGSLHQTVAA
ncbi:hypothetical protein EMB92_01345 [Bifidobacterium callitrichos]|uniref:Uncharacterized protein n=1 Tax=Bifidobacterium callitrichos TaxID=762209 RepID=A0A5M9ZE70_9BIFI|nr:hypothetical protein [Bifidobacterium callitrichos]KAA8817263.1 hypothetical protein EMB92_01345 [Bifidobacterium callitrichos]